MLKVVRRHAASGAHLPSTLPRNMDIYQPTQKYGTRFVADIFP